MSLTQVFTKNFSEENQQYDKVGSYESLISRICNASNMGDLLTIMHQNIGLYKNEHVVLTLRVLARLAKNLNPSQIESISQDERYKQLTSRAEEGIEEYNEYGNIGFCFKLY